MGALQELSEQIAKLPREYSVKLLPIAERALETQRRRKRVTGLVNEALSQLRLDITYLRFDRECLNRELEEARAN